MALQKSLIAGISFACFALSVIAVALPYWGFFEDANEGLGFGSDRGYFGPWRVCKELTYDRTRCGNTDNISRFRPSRFVLASGITIAVSCILLGIHCLISAIQMVSESFRGKMMMTKFILATIAALTTVAAAGCFAWQTDDLRRGFRVTKGISFYVVLVCAIMTIVLAGMSYNDLAVARRSTQPQKSKARGQRGAYDKPRHQELDHIVDDGKTTTV